MEELRLMEKLMEQWNATRTSMEAARQAAELADLRQAERLDTHVLRMEERLALQRRENEEVLQALQTSNRDNLRYAGVAVGLGLFSMFLLCLLQWRSTLKLTQIVLRPYGSGPAQLPPSPGSESAQSPVATGQETIRLIESLDRMERRIRELESAAAGGRGGPKVLSRDPQPEPVAGKAVPQIEATGAITLAAKTSADSTEPSEDGTNFFIDEVPKTTRSAVGSIVGKGEALLQLGQAGEALGTFEEALRLDPRFVEAWVKKGSALERLERMEEALVCYDRAIELDGSFTLAYLYKGGVCNRLERFDEALSCYEQALRSHETAAAS